ncbi:MAG: M20/M25/M40 family metallo-hydrolase [Bdellovibrionota bacterium]
MDFIEACRKIISFDSTPFQSTKAMMEWAAQQATACGLQVELQEEFVGDVPHANLIIRPQSGRSDAEFMLQTRLDTVDAGPYPLWEKNDQNPFDARIVDGKIYGLGSADVKLDFLCKLEAMKSFATRPKWTLTPVLVATFGEETGMSGALKLIRKNKVSPKMALIGEPSDLNLISAAKGFAHVEVEIPFSEVEIEYRQNHNLRESTSTQSRMFTGRAAHSATPHLGESAIEKMFTYMEQLPQNTAVMEIDGGISPHTVPAHAFIELDPVQLENTIITKIITLRTAIKSLEKEFSKVEDIEFEPKTPTLSIGMIRTQEETVVISGNCRIPPKVSQSIYEEWMESLRKVCDQIGAHFRIVNYKRPFRTERNSILVRGCLDILRQMDLPSQCITQASTNEASLFARTGIDCVCFGAGKREGNLHTPTENVDIEHLHKATEFYKKAIERFCL